MRIKENSLLSRVLTATLPWIIYTLQRMVRLTIQKKYLNAEPFERIRQSKEPYILAVWHCCVLWAPFFHRNHGIKAMISPSRDGEIIARVVESSGNQCVRGSSGKNTSGDGSSRTNREGGEGMQARARMESNYASAMAKPRRKNSCFSCSSCRKYRPC